MYIYICRNFHDLFLIFSFLFQQTLRYRLFRNLKLHSCIQKHQSTFHTKGKKFPYISIFHVAVKLFNTQCNLKANHPFRSTFYISRFSSNVRMFWFIFHHLTHGCSRAMLTRWPVYAIIPCFLWPLFLSYPLIHSNPLSHPLYLSFFQRVLRLFLITLDRLHVFQTLSFNVVTDRHEDATMYFNITHITGENSSVSRYS